MESTGAPTGAIVFTDIVGFTQLTDERGDDIALALLERQEKIVRSALPECARVVKELGDGLLLWFDDPCEAIETCLRLQREFEAMADDDPPLWVRIGMHFGTPRRRGDDIVGRDVNLAARIVDLAAPGEVLCSETTANVAGEQDSFAYEALGPVFVRGIADAIPIMRVVAPPW
jgi:class 3 adenylate cyclase